MKSLLKQAVAEEFGAGQCDQRMVFWALAALLWQVLGCRGARGCALCSSCLRVDAVNLSRWLSGREITFSKAVFYQGKHNLYIVNTGNMTGF